MAQSDTVRALFALMIGIAWADREITAEEMDLLKDIIFRTHSITEQDWAEFEIYWITPLGEVELQRLAQRFLGTLRSEENKQAAKAVIHDLAAADGQITPQEGILLRELDRGIDRAQPTLLPDLSHLLAEALPKRSNTILGKDFQQRTVINKLKQKYGQHIAAQMGLYEDELRKLSLAGALMGHIAYADQQLDQEEFNIMRQVVQREWSLSEDHAEVLLEFALDAVDHRLELYRLVRQFFELTTYQERVDFIDLLFEIARARDHISVEEMDEIEGIAEALKLRYDDFQASKQRAVQRIKPR